MDEDFSAELGMEMVDETEVVIERPRKYSEGYREIAAVDSNIPNLPSVEEGANDPAEEGPVPAASAATGPHGAYKCPTTNVVVSALSGAVATSGFIPTIYQSESFLKSLPMAVAQPEVWTAINDDMAPSSTSPVLRMTADANLHMLPVASQVVPLAPLPSKQRPRPSIICVKIYKPDKDTKLGMRVQLSADGHLQVGKLAGRLGEQSSLRTGDQILRLNNQNAVAWTTTKALNCLRECWGWVTIVVRTDSSEHHLHNPAHDSSDDSYSSNHGPALCQASVCKRDPSDKLGISFQKVKVEGNNGLPLLRIKQLNVAGILGGQSTIRVGDIVDSINNIPCTKLDNATAINLLRSSPDWVHITVKTGSHVPVELATQTPAIEADHHVHVDVEAYVGVDAHHDPDHAQEHSDLLPSISATELVNVFDDQDRDSYLEPALVSVSIPKTKKMEKLDITLVRIDNVLYIQKLSGFLSDSILREGMSIVALNDRLACRMTAKEATGFLRDAVASASLPTSRRLSSTHHSSSTIRILARNPHGNPRYVQAMVYKKQSSSRADCPRNVVGVSFKGSTGRPLRVCEIRQDGLFVDSCLSIGDSVLSVNGVECQYARPKEAVDLVRSSVDSVTILAKTKSNSAIVVARIA